MFGPLFHWHQKIITKKKLAGGLSRNPPGKKKCPFRSNGTGSLAGAWRCIVDISEGCCQPDWKKGFFESTSLEKGGFLRTSRRIHTNEIYTWCIQYRGICIWKRNKHTKCLQRSANDKSSTFQIFIKLITSPMCPAGRCWNCTKSDLLELTNVESPHGLWCWTTSSEHPWKQLHVVGVMHCPDIKPENSGEDQFKGKSWVPLGEYPRYKATKKNLLIWDYIMLV